MQSVTFIVPDDEKFDFTRDITAWEKVSGKDARLTLGTDFPKTSTKGSPIIYICQIDDTFFEQFPEWRQYIEQ